ncbi:28725_t:CDS:2, partial [Dentiscutata erythropus]
MAALKPSYQIKIQQNPVFDTSQNHTTKHKPFYLMYSQHTIVPLDLQLQGSKETQNNIRNAQERQKGYYNKSIKSIEFKIGDQVLLYESAKEKVYSNKLREKWKGPYFVHDYRVSGAYKLRTVEEK